MGSEDLIAETAARIFADLCDPVTLNRQAGDAWKAPAWKALEGAGLTLAWVPEALGGAGAEIGDGFAIVRQAGRFAAALPVAETLLAGWLLAGAKVSSPRGTMSLGPVRAGEEVTLSRSGLTGRLHAVPQGRGAEHLALLAQQEGGGAVVALLAADQAQISEGSNLAGDARNLVTFAGAEPLAVAPAPPGLDEQGVLLMGAVTRAVQMTGALEAILQLAVAYANERIAFERPIAKFQAVQHNLARLAGEVAAAIAASGSAAEAIAASATSEAVFLEAASAKIRVGEAVGQGAGIAHQVLGAIGFTHEHVLHRFTRRLWAWRDDFGNESAWAARLGSLVAGKGADGLWPMLADR
jgi:acyl-CoA dehydrogenase